MNNGYLRIRHWDHFQHYKDRNPPWIKNYTELLSDEAYLQLSGHRRAILHGLWLEYARSNCRLSLDTRMLTRRLNLKVTTSDIEALNHAGFVVKSASAPQSPRAKSAMPETEKRQRRGREETDKTKAFTELAAAEARLNGPKALDEITPKLRRL